MDVAAAGALVHSDDPAAVEQGIEWFRRQAETDPGNAAAWFEYGGALDYSDREAAAMVAYQRVFDLGLDRLPIEDQPRLIIQAGSTLRNLGRRDEARSILERGRREFPDVRAIAAFLALVEVSAGNDLQAVHLLFEVLLAPDDGSIAYYQRALAWYADDIRGGM